jgi:hypothetical protein
MRCGASHLVTATLWVFVGCGGGTTTTAVDGGNVDAFAGHDARDAGAGDAAAGDAAAGDAVIDATVAPDTGDATAGDDATIGEDAPLVDDATAADAPVFVCPASMSGAGTEAAPCLVTSCVQLQAMQEGLTLWYRLANDIDCAATASWNGGAGFAPVGQCDDYGMGGFTGHLEGAHHVVTGLSIHRTVERGVGLFGCAGSPSTIADVELASLDVSGAHQVAGLVGGQEGGTITRCSTAGNVTGAAGATAAGLVGGQASGTITDSSSSVTVSSEGSAGGLVGTQGSNGSDPPLVTGSHATGSVTGFVEIGGLVGLAYSSGVITRSYATGTVTGYSGDVGGLAGGHSGTITESFATGDVIDVGGAGGAGGLVGSGFLTITNCYATGNVQGWYRVGGLVASCTCTITNSFAAGNVTGDTAVGGLAGTWGGDGALIVNSFAAGRVLGSTSYGRGGLVGARDGGTITNSFWFADGAGNAADCYYEDSNPGNDGCTKITSGASYFYGTANPPLDAWDFATTPIWSTICNGGAFPPLALQSLAACP